MNVLFLGKGALILQSLSEDNDRKKFASCLVHTNVFTFLIDFLMYANKFRIGRLYEKLKRLHSGFKSGCGY